VNVQILDLKQERLRQHFRSPRGEHITHPVTQQIEAQDDDDNGQSGKNGNPPLVGEIPAPSAIMVPRLGSGGCTPGRTKLSMEPMMITQATSRLILVKMGERVLGRISRKMMCAVLAPVTSAAVTKYSLRKATPRP